jgi:hypothetical protein
MAKFTVVDIMRSCWTSLGALLVMKYVLLILLLTEMYSKCTHIRHMNIEL